MFLWSPTVFRQRYYQNTRRRQAGSTIVDCTRLDSSVSISKELTISYLWFFLTLTKGHNPETSVFGKHLTLFDISLPSITLSAISGFDEDTDWSDLKMNCWWVFSLLVVAVNFGAEGKIMKTCIKKIEACNQQPILFTRLCGPMSRLPSPKRAWKTSKFRNRPISCYDQLIKKPVRPGECVRRGDTCNERTSLIKKGDLRKVLEFRLKEYVQ